MAAPPFVVPEPHSRSPEFMRLWDLYLDVRRAKRSSNTAKTLAYVFETFLQPLEVESAAALLKIAVDRSWVGLMYAVSEAQRMRIPLRPATASKPTPPPQPEKKEPDNWRDLLQSAAVSEAVKRGISRHERVLEDLTYTCLYGEGGPKELWQECLRIMEESTP